MTHKILKSAFAPPPVSLEEAKGGFGQLVNAYLHELRVWQEHDNQVKSQQPMRAYPKPEDHVEADDPAVAFWTDQAAWHTEKLARFDPYPKPIAHPDIVAAVATNTGADGNITYASDYEIENDDPTPGQILTTKKAALLQAVLQAEAEALKAVQLSAGKQRAALLLENDIRTQDNELAKELAAELTAHARTKPLMNIDVAAEVAAEVKRRRDPKHTRHLVDQESRRTKAEAIARAAAEVMSDIEDLTSDTVDTFVLPIRFILKTETLPSRGRN